MNARIHYFFVTLILLTACAQPASNTVKIGVTPDKPVTQGVRLFLVDLEGKGGQGTEIGCGDRLVSVPHTVTTDDSSLPATVIATLQALLEVSKDEAAAMGYYTVLDDMDIAVSGATVREQVLYVDLVGTPVFGGVCDTPRFYGQIEETAGQFPGVTELVVRLNGSVELYKELGSGQG